MSCGITFAEWHCAKCNLWMDLSKRPFHCDKCGICRVGGRDKFQHCEQCCMCISTTMLETHNCIKDKYKSELIITFYTVIVGCHCVSYPFPSPQPTARSAMKICLVLGRAPRNCHVAMQFTVTVSETWQGSTIVARSAKRP